ncbi:hypothetical protein [Sulfitobacter geojensis]|uniref:hypothetical protein n=1 Tax=Sulfitobacter geojensis TaxID=1342299 RepID=UPI0036DBF869
MPVRRAILALTAAAVLSSGAAPVALACAFHGYTPDPTLVDVLLATEEVVIARVERGGRAFAPAETLAGPQVTQIALRPSAQTRIAAQRNTDLLVLLARDGSYGPWQEVTPLEGAMGGVMRAVLSQHAAWQSGDLRPRVAFFARHLNASAPALRGLALREMDRADYATLRKSSLPRVAGLRQDLRQDDDALRPIRILLAGLSGDRSFVPLLSEALAKGVSADKAYLGAYATALIELDGVGGVEHVVARYLSEPDLAFDQREKLVQALALQYRVAPAGVRRSIARDVARLSRQDAGFAQSATRQFGSANRFNPSPAVAGATDR